MLTLSFLYPVALLNFLGTFQDCFFTRGEYQQLVYQALAGLPGLEIVPPSDDIRTLPPAILKPVQRWTGKQVTTHSPMIFLVFNFLFSLLELALFGSTRPPAYT